MKKDGIHRMYYGKNDYGDAIYCYELNERQHTYLRNIVENHEHGIAPTLRIRTILGQGYYFKEDVDFLNGLKNKAGFSIYANLGKLNNRYPK